MSIHKIGEEVFIYGLGYIVWDEGNEQAARDLLDEIECIAPEFASEQRKDAK